MPSENHMAAKQMWAESTDSLYSRNPAYYHKQENVLRDDILPAVGNILLALDIGCGEGRFCRAR